MTTTKTAWTKEERERLLTIIETAALGALALVALSVLEIDVDKIAVISAPQWALIATGVGGLIVAVRNALRGSVRRSPTPVRADRERATIPPPREEGSVQIGALLWLALVGGLALLTLPGCGAGALGDHARAAVVMGSTVESADALADAGGEIAMHACEALTGTADERTACTHEVERVIASIDTIIEAAKLAILLYQSSIEVAIAAGESGPAVDVALVSSLVRILGGWAALVALAHEIDVELPPVPPDVLALAGGPS